MPMQVYPKHYCGVFGVFGHPNAAELTYYGLYALQHRGQESAGIVTSDGKQFREHKGMGLVPQIFDGEILMDWSGKTPSATRAIPPLARPICATPSRSRWTAGAGASPSPTTATSQMPRNCAMNSKRAARFSRRRWIVKSFCTCSHSRA